MEPTPTPEQLLKEEQKSARMAHLRYGRDRIGDIDRRWELRWKCPRCRRDRRRFGHRDVLLALLRTPWEWVNAGCEGCLRDRQLTR